MRQLSPLSRAYLLLIRWAEEDAQQLMENETTDRAELGSTDRPVADTTPNQKAGGQSDFTRPAASRQSK
jgi:hypothetical protein